MNEEKIKFLNEYAERMFSSILSACETAIMYKDKKSKSSTISKEECNRLYNKLQRKEKGVLSRFIFLHELSRQKPTPMAFEYKELIRMMNFYNKESISLEDLDKLRNQKENGECKVYDLFYKNQYCAEAELVYHGRLLERHKEEGHTL